MALLDRAGNPTRTYAYSPYGETEEGYAEEGTPFLFQDDYLDPGTSLYHMQARWYDPASSSFLSPDPEMGEASDPQARLPYAYCGGDPVYNSDPEGKTPRDLALAMRNPALAGMIMKNRALMLAILLKPGSGRKGSFLGGLLGNRRRAEEKAARSNGGPQANNIETQFLRNIPGLPERILGNAERPSQEKTTGICKDERGIVFVTYSSGDKTVTINLGDPYVKEGIVNTQYKWYQYATDIFKSIFRSYRVFPLGRRFTYRATLMYESASSSLKLVVETSTEPGGGSHSPYGNVEVLQHTDVVTREGRRYEMSPLDPGTRIVPPGDISGRANYHSYIIEVTPEDMPFRIYSYNLYSWDQGINFKGTAGLEEIGYEVLPRG
ncbi:MAG: RHS repeat-associated core domain-containing protein [Actinobacteria bacterium]|nr:RHS repeat-associated core domain-containing protein [Actinomycetota bacterium]